ncbi:MAG: pilus assembly protein PilP [Deltaproteobacteria bacterium]|nr:pilus assembly protein PilP [Deltaproteobacteria bacterium]
MSNRLLRNSVCLVSLLGWVALCASMASAAQDVVYKDSMPMKKVFEDRKGPGAPASPAEQAKEGRVAYDPTGKTDPFKTFLAEPQEVGEDKKVARRPKTFLETVDLSQLELIAIVVGPKGNWGMVRDSKGVGHVIQKGTLIGTNGGVVHAITDKEVTIREEYKDFKGKAQYKDIAKKLPGLLAAQ